ncbi:MAG: hypothetical protein ABI311_09080 [Gemmatimonadaceae bacterium]
MQPIVRGILAYALIGGLLSSPGALAAQTPATLSAASQRPSLELASPSTLAPFRAGGRFFHVAASGELRVRDGEKGVERAILPAGTFSIVAPSPDGRYIAYTVGPAHPGPYDVRVRDVQSGRDLPDVLHLSRMSPAPWSHDNKGFLYVREDASDGRQRVYYHGLGREPSKDALILSQFDHPEWRYAARVSDDGTYAVFTISYPADSNTRIYFIDLANPGKPNFGAPVVKLTQSFDSRYDFVDNAGAYFFLQTNNAAPRGRIVLANTSIIRESRWPAVIPQADDSLLFARTAGDQYLVAVYRTSAGADVAKVFGPEDPAVLRQEMRNRFDSLKNVRDKENDKRPVRPMGSRGFMGNGPAIRLSPRSDIPLPVGSRIIAMNALADQQQLFYTLKLSDGTTQSFVYDVTNGRNEPYQTRP